MSGRLRNLFFSMLVLVALALLVYHSRNAIRLADFNWQRLWDEVKGTRKSLLCGAVAAIYLAFALRSLRWKRFCHYLGPITFADVYGATLMGFTGVFVLGRVGEPLRPVLLSRKSGLPVLSMFGIYILERLLDVVAAAVVAALSLLMSPALRSSASGGQAWQVELRAAGGMLLGGMAALMAFVIYFRWHGAGAIERRMAGWHESNTWRRRVAAQFDGFSQGLQAIRSVSDLLAALSYSALHWLTVIVIYVLILHSFGGVLAALDFRAAMMVLAFTLVGSTLQLPGVGGGAQVATFIVLTHVFGIEAEPAAAAAILIWLITFGSGCVVGGPLLIREGWSLGELRRLASAEAQAEDQGEHVTEILADKVLGVPGSSRNSAT
jgi:glycosyltransferase 2 family protein